MSNQLPSPFATLEPFVDWALDTQTRRLYRRLEQPMEQLQTFYDAMLPLMPEILVYLDEFPCGELPLFCLVTRHKRPRTCERRSL